MGQPTRAGGRCSGTGPSLAPPADLAAFRLDVEGQAFALLEWSSAALGLPRARHALTSAEAAVATLAVAGSSNAQIARARGCSPRTVANQIASAFRKLGVHSRAELAAVGFGSR